MRRRIALSRVEGRKVEGRPRACLGAAGWLWLRVAQPSAGSLAAGQAIIFASRSPPACGHPGPASTKDIVVAALAPVLAATPPAPAGSPAAPAPARDQIGVRFAGVILTAVTAILASGWLTLRRRTRPAGQGSTRAARAALRIPPGGAEPAALSWPPCRWRWRVTVPGEAGARPGRGPLAAVRQRVAARCVLPSPRTDRVAEWIRLRSLWLPWRQVWR